MAQEMVFQSSWFTVSILTELMVLLVMRTHKSFYRSKPAPILLYTSLMVAIITIILPVTPLANAFSLTPVRFELLMILIGITVADIVVTKLAKSWFYKNHQQ